jgi:hypothetical protein
MWSPFVRTVDHATWFGDQVSSLHHLWTLYILITASSGHVDKTFFCKCANTWPAGEGDVAGWPHLGSVELVLCATSVPRVILFVTMPYFGHNEDMHDFCPYGAFPLSDVPEMVDQQNVWNALVISTYLLYLE